MAQQLTTDILNAALENLTSKRRQIDEQIAEVRRLLGATTDGTSATPEAAARKGRMSAAGRRAIAEAQRRRWAEKKAAAQPTAVPAETKKPKRKLSAAGRRAIVAALKKRWAAKRAAASTAGKVASKKKSRAKASAKRAKVKAIAAPAERQQ
jgi:hypothetical protein